MYTCIYNTCSCGSTDPLDGAEGNLDLSLVQFERYDAVICMNSGRRNPSR